MNSFIVLIVVLYCTIVSASPFKKVLQMSHKEPPPPPIGIIGGVEATPHSLPYQVAIIVDNRYLCGGALISPCHVLTVAHCLYGAKSAEVILGAHNLAKFESTRRVLRSSTFILHEQFKNGSLNNDIALIKFDTHVKPTSAIRPISLPDPKCGNFSNTSAHLSGWGQTSIGSDASMKLRIVYLSVLDNVNCKADCDQKVPINASHICTSGRDSLVGPVGACNGDSGGPLVNKDELIGLVSFGFKPCASGMPTVYTRISSFRTWITDHSGV